jgi:hypothetical protein
MSEMRADYTRQDLTVVFGLPATETPVMNVFMKSFEALPVYPGLLGPPMKSQREALNRLLKPVKRKTLSFLIYPKKFLSDY